MKTNFHTHHQLCGHAGGTAEDYALEAIKHGFEELGFSDHAPFDKYDLGFRMRNQDLQTYIDDVEQTKKTYKNRLTIYKGLEIEHFYNEDEYYTQLLANFDYFILGQHFISMEKNNKNMISSFGLHTKEQILMYAETLCDAMHTKRYKIIAHPELYLHGYLDFDETAEVVARKICECAVMTNTILEYNGNGHRRQKMKTPQGYLHPYPRKSFWKIAEEYGVHSILSSDCHHPSQLYDDTMVEVEEEYSKIRTQKVTYFNQF